jgi:hypothetical protein
MDVRTHTNVVLYGVLWRDEPVLEMFTWASLPGPDFPERGRVSDMTIRPEARSRSTLLR